MIYEIFMKFMIRIVGQPDMITDGEFEDVVMEAATAASALCCRERQVVRFFLFEGHSKILMYQSSVGYIYE